MCGMKHTDKDISIIRGKNLVGKATKADVNILLDHIDALEDFLDEHDQGTEGWRRRIGLDRA
jgi:hypothetical protein